MMPSASGSTSTPSFVGDVAEMGHQHVGLDPPQVETLAARQHRDRDFADFGGGEHEFGVLRRFFQRLQEGIEGRRRQHVDFVDDVDLVARAGRRIAHAVIDLADVVDAGMGGGVHFQHVHVPAFHDRLAVHAEVRHVDGRPLHRAIRLFVVQRTGENPRGRGFADAADAGQDPGLRNPARLERIRDGADHGLLADQVVETGRAVFACQHPVRLGHLVLPPRAKPPWPAPSDLSGGAPASLIGRSAIDCLSAPACGKERNQREARTFSAFLARFARKTGRRLTSDPIRTSLGLLPSGPDPVGEWLVHRQSPGPYLGPKGPESKRGRMGAMCGTTHVSSWPGLTRPSTSCFFNRTQKRRGCLGHLARKRASARA